MSVWTIISDHRVVRLVVAGRHSHRLSSLPIKSNVLFTLTTVWEHIGVRVLQDPDPDVYITLCFTDGRSARLPLLTLTAGGKTPQRWRLSADKIWKFIIFGFPPHKQIYVADGKYIQEVKKLITIKLHTVKVIYQIFMFSIFFLFFERENAAYEHYTQRKNFILYTSYISCLILM